MTSPLTTANLAGLEEGTSPKPEDIKYLFRVGISKNTAYDYIYSEERRARFVYSDRLGTGKVVHGRLYVPPNGPYQYLIYYPDYPNGKPVLPLQFNAIWDQATWNRLVHNELDRIRKSAQEKRNKLHALVIKCPYKPWMTIMCESMTTIPTAVLGCMKSLPMVIWCPLITLFAIIFYSLYPSMLIMVLLPIASVKDTCCPADQVSRANWFEELYKANPDIDTFAIDNEVKRELDMIAEKINTAYPQLVVDVGVCQDSKEWASYDEGSVHVEKSTEYFDRFILQFREAPKTK